MGDLDADVTVDGNVADPITANHLPSGRTIKIGTSLQSDSTHDGRIVLGTSGLQGQVIINSTNGSGTWTGNVTIGTTTLSPSYYSNTSSSLGGGAVGVAPFHLHAADCVPPSVYNSVGATMTVSHYGPVT